MHFTGFKILQPTCLLQEAGRILGTEVGLVVTLLPDKGKCAPKESTFVERDPPVGTLHGKRAHCVVLRIGNTQIQKFLTRTGKCPGCQKYRAFVVNTRRRTVLKTQIHVHIFPQKPHSSSRLPHLVSRVELFDLVEGECHRPRSHFGKRCLTCMR